MSEPETDRLQSVSPLEASTHILKGDVLSFSEIDKQLMVSTGWLGVSMTRSDQKLIDVVLPGEMIRSGDSQIHGLNYIGITDVSMILSPPGLITNDAVISLHGNKSGPKYLGVMDRLYLALNTDGELRLAHLILMLMDRSKLSNPKLYDRFFCPLSQTQIGDLIGVSNVHVSRIFSRLEQKTLIRRHKSFIEIVNRTELERLCSYTTRWK